MEFTPLPETLTRLLSLAHSIEEVDRSNKSIQEEFQVLYQDFEQITLFSKHIQDIADQTKMLSLNASIEAARASEQGAGFRVIAKEIRGLSERTKKNAEQIAKMSSELNEHAQIMQGYLRHFDVLTHEQKSVVEASEEVSETLVTQMEVTLDQMSTIAANTQEQAAASQLVEQSMDSVMEETNALTREIHQTGRDVYQVSRNIEALRQSTIGPREELPMRVLWRAVQTDHLLWKWNLYNLYLGYHTMDQEELVDPHQCRLGKWYDAKQQDPQLRNVPAFQRLGTVHETLHAQARRVYGAIQQEDRAMAKMALDQLEESSESVVRAIQELEKGMSNRDNTTR